jgi:GNAT superfamily N-acetyltransferase
MALSGHARSLQASFLRTRAIDGDEPALAFLAHRGFAEVAREHEVRLDLGAAAAAPPPATPAGVAIVSLAERPDLARQVHELALEVNDDGPSLAGSVVPPFEEWLVENVDEAVLAGSLLAIADGRVIGATGLWGRPGDPGLAEHLLTAVAAPWRRRGIARALKLRQIEWARAEGYRELATFNAESNLPMRRLNDELGYLPMPVQITFRGPLAEPEG